MSNLLTAKGQPTEVQAPSVAEFCLSGTVESSKLVQSNMLWLRKGIARRQFSTCSVLGRNAAADVYARAQNKFVLGHLIMMHGILRPALANCTFRSRPSRRCMTASSSSHRRHGAFPLRRDLTQADSIAEPCAEPDLAARVSENETGYQSTRTRNASAHGLAELVTFETASSRRPLRRYHHAHRSQVLSCSVSTCHLVLLEPVYLPYYSGTVLW